MDPAAARRQLVNQCFFDVQFNPFGPHGYIFPVVDGHADPTDRSLDLVSSPEHGAARENGHDPAALGDEDRLHLRYIHALRFFHRLLRASGL
jgi:hypothetical protein